MRKPALIILFFFVALQAKSQSLSQKEKQIIQYIDQHLPDAKRLLIETVNINSGTLNKEGVKKVGTIFSKELEKAGLHAG